MCALYDGRETTILDTPGLLVKGQAYHAVLTGQQILLTGEGDHISRSISLREVWRIGQDTDPSGDPVIIVSIRSAGGVVHSIVLHFPRWRFPNAFQLRALWVSEINRLLQQSVPDPRPVTRQDAPTPLFCPECGNRLAGGSAFCDRCGRKIPYLRQPVFPEQDYGRDQDHAVQPKVSTGAVDMPRKSEAVSTTEYAGTRQKTVTPPSLPKEVWMKKPFFSGSLLEKPALIIGVCLAVMIIAAAAFVMIRPSGSPVFGPVSVGLNGTLPGLGAIASPVHPEGTTPANPEIPGSPAGLDVPPAEPAATFVPGDPGAVLATYPFLFNKGDGSGLRALLSEEIKSDYSLDNLNDELDIAQSNGNSIENIHVKNQIIDGDRATLIAEISWKTSESPVSQTQNLLLVHENGQWKLNTLILHP